MGKYALNCFRCDKLLENVWDHVENQPYDGTTFITRGHYGSTFFDPMDHNSWLEINICDECLNKNNKHSNLLLKY
jgi:hypothetical protein